MKKSPIILYILVFLILSCTKSNDKGNLQTLKVYENIDKQKRSFLMDQMAGYKEIIKLETTDSSLISNVNIKFTTLQYICLLDNNMIFFFDQTGKFKFKINSKGEGPNEYNSISNVVYNSIDSTFYIHDMFKKKMLEYQLNGRYLGEITIDNIGSIIDLDNNFYVVSYSPYANKSKLVGILDHSFNIMNEFIGTNFNNENYADRGYILINDFIQSNHTKCIKPISSDTIYKIYPNKVQPYFFIEKGRLAIPIEILSDVSQNNKFKNYITNDYGLIINNLYFMTFYYNNKLYQDIWDIETSKLLYRNIASSVNDKYGAPIHLNDEIINVWPIFVDSQSVYCKIDERDQLLLKTNIEENDILLKIKVEK